MSTKDLPADASPELRAVAQTNEHIQRLALFLSGEMTDLRIAVTVQHNMLRTLLALQGMSPEDLEAKIAEGINEARTHHESLTLERWKNTALDSTD